MIGNSWFGFLMVREGTCLQDFLQAKIVSRKRDLKDEQKFIRRMESSKNLKSTQSTVLNIMQKAFLKLGQQNERQEKSEFFEQHLIGWKWSEMKKDKAAGIAKQLLILVLGE